MLTSTGTVACVTGGVPNAITLIHPLNRVNVKNMM